MIDYQKKITQIQVFETWTSESHIEEEEEEHEGGNSNKESYNWRHPSNNSR